MSQHRTPPNAKRFVTTTNPAESQAAGTFQFRTGGSTAHGASTGYPRQREQRYTWPERSDAVESAPRNDYDWFTERTPSFEPDRTAPAQTTRSAPARRGGAHRLPAPPTALKGRAAVVAVAAGAVVAAGQAALSDGPDTDAPTSEITLDAKSTGVGTTAVPQAVQFVAATDSTAPGGKAPEAGAPAAGDSTSPQVLNVAAPVDLGQFSNLLSKGQKFAQERAAAEAAKMRPLFSTFSHGTFTSGFGARWGAQHLGVDLANSIGTPILAVEDGEVIDAGPASGFGMWVRLKHADGTITVYGHIDSATVSVGQHVMAGDEIAKMGNRGFSTGPHCHFEVWQNGTDKIDPLPWLASRGISLGPERD